jgi:membrane protein DedA with SNARE-associated domain
VESFLTHLVLSSNGMVAYGVIFGVLVACGLGAPLPEDISLILGGFLAHEGAVRLPAMIAVGFVGILIGDTFIYLAGRRVGRRMVAPTGLLARVVTPAKKDKVERLFASHGEKIVMIARFLPGVRAVTYFTAGSAGMSYLRFILWDGVAALGSAPLLVYLGYHFGQELEQVIGVLKRGQFALIALVLTVVGVLLFRRWRQTRLTKDMLEHTHPPEASAPKLVEPVVEPKAPRENRQTSAVGSASSRVL